MLEVLYEAGDIAEVGTTLFVLDVAGEGEEASAQRAQPEPVAEPVEEVRPLEVPNVQRATPPVAVPQT